MEIKNLRTFIQIAEAGSFSKAAEQLGYTQSTISFQIRQLEDELQCRVFDRVGKKTMLTDRGELLLKHALRLNNDLQDLQESFHNQEILSGQVRMFSSDSICERMMLLNYHEFYETYPEIHLIFQTGSTLDMLNLLDRNDADIIFTLDSHIYQQEYVIIRESPVPLHFVTNSAHDLARAQTLALKDLVTYPFLLTERKMSYRKILDNHLAELAMQIDPVLETGRTDILVKSLIRGRGVGFLPDFVTEEEVQAGNLVRLNVTDFEPIIWKQLIVHRDKWISRPLQAFIDFVSEHEFRW